MTSAGAFRGDPAVKAEAIADAAAAGHPGWTNVAPDEDRLACAETFGLSPNFVTLLSVASNAPYWDGSSAFVADCLTAVPPGADTLALARRWALSLWAEGPHPIEVRLAGTAAHEPAQAVFAAAGGDAAVSRQAWRALRAQLASVEGLSATARAYADIAAALAWDEDSVPGVHADVWKAWQEAIRIANDAAAGWDQATLDATLDALREANVAAHAIVSPRFDGRIDTDEARAAQAHEVAAIMATSPVGGTFAALQDHWRDSVAPTVRDARAAGLRSILDACRAAASQVIPSTAEPGLSAIG